MMRPDNDTPEQPEQHEREPIRTEQNMLEQKQPKQEPVQQERQEQNLMARQRAEAVAAPRRAVTPSGNLPVAQMDASTPLDACARLQPDLKAYQDGQVGWWRRQQIGRHLGTCAVCREEMEAMREFSDKWRGADAEVLDPGLRARILAAVPDVRPAASAITPSRRRPLPLALAGAGVCAVIGGIALYPVVMSKTDRAMQSDATRTLSAPPASAFAANAGQAQNRSQSYAAAGAATNGSAAAAPSVNGNGPASAASAPPANPAGMQIADARQLPLDQDGSVPGGSGRAPRDRDASGSAASSQIQADASKEDYNKSAQAAAGTAAPPPPAAAREAAADNAPVMANTPGGSQTTSHTMSKASAPASPPSSAPPNKTANAPGTEAAGSPRRTDHSQSAGSFAPFAPDPEKQANASKQAVLPARIAEEPRKYKTGLSRSATNKVANKEGEAAKSASASAMPSPARLAAAEGASRRDTDADTPNVMLKIRVAQAETVAADIERNVRALGGTVVTSEMTTAVGGAKSALLRLKAPAVSLDTFLTQAVQTGTVLSKTVVPARPTAADATTKGHSRAFAAQKGGRAQTNYVNITVVLQGQ